jgi:UDP-2-acetamido-3-amino-2,3-dideoxy-glucuronate N-acetyltransferase
VTTISTQARIEASADVDERATIGAGTRIWHLAQIREDAVIGSECVIGRGAYVGPGVRLGDRCKVQNHALVYEPAEVGDGVFIGPAVVFTNDEFPRAVTPEGALKTEDDWTMVAVKVLEGAAIGARSVCIAPLTIGRWALVAAGSVVTRDVPDYGLVAGVPARRIGWVGRAGRRLEPGEAEGRWVCPVTGEVFVEDAGRLRPQAG